MHPIERLRFVARSEGEDPAEVALAAADALADLASEPRALVLACRRLLDAQAGAAPLWWLSAHILASADPAAAARACARGLAGDGTALELADALPAGTAVVAEAASSALGALGERPDCSVALVGTAAELTWALRDLAGGPAGGPAAVGYEPDELAAGLEGAGIAVVEARAASPSRLLLGEVGAALASAAAGRGVALWVAAGVGRVLPEPLFDACARGAEQAVVVPAGLADQVAGPSGLVPPAAGLDPGDCPAPASLAGAPSRR